MTRRAALVALALAWPAAARADLFSPGELTKAHADLEGLGSCTKCHAAGERLSPDKCLECHKELRERIRKGQGLHGRLADGERACEGCHHEHQGRAHELVDWGAGGRKGFDHARTGWKLTGKHAALECAKCHDARLVTDAAVKQRLAEKPAARTLLGLESRCNACHFDEHRGQTGADCDRCHTTAQFRPPLAFDHARTAFALQGRHAKVACDKCHRREEDVATPRDAFPAPRAWTFARLRPVAHAACTDCHKDPHDGRFGAACASCHSPDGWKAVRDLGKERAFHEKTRFPLRGAHAGASCAACHGQPAKYRNLQFWSCGACHADAHVGQLAGSAPGRPPDCARCHDETSFKPARFGVAEHAKTRHPLQGAHAATACAKCHPIDPELARRVPEATRKELRAAKRPERFSFARLALGPQPSCTPCHADAHGGQLAAGAASACERCHDASAFLPARFELEDHEKTRYPLEGAHAAVACVKCHPRDRVAAPPVARPTGPLAVRASPAKLALGTPTGCDSCHADPHAGQLAGRKCSECHEVSSFRRIRFDHQGSRFPLEGRHATTPCAACHRASGTPAVVRYKPLETACEACHADVHAAQFASGGGTDCARCHRTDGFRSTRFAHAPPFTSFRLDGRHERLACGKCHPDVEVEPGVRVRRYRPLPQACEGCHEDHHRGTFARLVPGATAGADTRCGACHSTAGWSGARIDHERTGFALRGAHETVGCRDCHGDSLDAPLPRDCAGCHRDPHAGRQGRRCERCHEETAWLPARFDAEAHRRTAFPLTGRHAALPCTECHADTAAPGFGLRTRACVDCHARDFATPRFDHAAARTGTDCRACHGPGSFRAGVLPAHERCFQIAAGEHAGIACRDCHTTLPSGVGACASGTAACSSCHEHSCGEMEQEHDDVPGFQCKDRKCYECHRFSGGH